MIFNRYINGTFQVQIGPSSKSDELVFKDDYLSALEPGYEVRKRLKHKFI